MTDPPRSAFAPPGLRRIAERLSTHRGLAAALTIPAAVVLALTLRPIAQRVSFVMLVPAVIATAWYAGVLGGLLAAGVAAAATAIFLSGPLNTDAGVELFVIETVVVFMTAMLAAALGRADRRLAASLERERHLRAEAEAGSLAKSEFLAMLAHELRQPIGALIAASTLFKEHADATVQERAGQVIIRQAQHLARLIEDLSDVSKVHVQRLDVSFTDVKLHDVLNDVVEALTPSLTERQQLLRVDSSENVVLRADGQRLRQMLSNLLGNAVKFTDTGGQIHLGVDIVDSQVEISVTDTGAGIAASDLRTIFDLFRHGDHAASGLGIGLSLVKAFAEVHGGSVHAYSAGIGCGSRFTVCLPLKQPPTIV